MTMSDEITIKKLEKPIEVLFEQYICEACEKKSYINNEDKKNGFLHCPFCKAEAKNKRIFNIEIKGIGEYK